MHVRCPHCQNPIEVVDEEQLSGELGCPSCGSHFSLVSDGQTLKHEHEQKSIGHFELVRQVGMGAFGAVWMARDSQLDRLVAIKVPRKGQLSRPEAEQFLREARAAAQLKHPGIVTIHEVGRHEDSIHIVSDFIQGVTLADWLSAKRPTPREAAELCAKIADALDHAHQRGVIHRDLKPGNIFISTEGDQPLEPHITDFGLAKREAGEITMTVDGKILGTPAYMSPEQARGEAHQADRRSDVYSLGVILFELFTGVLPFRGNMRMLLAQILNDEPPRLRTLNDRLPRDLETITLKCLEKDPARRYPSAAALAEDLRRFLRNEPISARPLGVVERSWRWSKRKPLAAGLLAALGVLVVVLIIATTTITAAYHRESQLAQDNLDLANKESLARVREAGLAASNLKLAEEEKQARIREAALGANNLKLAQEEAKARRRAQFALNQLMFQDGLTKAERRDYRGSSAMLCKALVDLEQAAAQAKSEGFDPLPEAAPLANAIRAHLMQVSLSELRHVCPHNGEVYDVAFSPDGKRIATASQDLSARIWDVETGKMVVFIEQPGPVIAVVFSPDGTKLATATSLATARLWNAANGAPIGPVMAHTAPVTKIAFSPDGRILATAARESLVRFWDTSTGLQNGEPIDAYAPVSHIAFSPDGKRLATASAHEYARVWDIATRKPVSGEMTHPKFVRQVAFSPDGSKVATACGDYTARIWDVETGKLLIGGMQHRGVVNAVTFSPNGKLLATGGADSYARLFNTNDGSSRGEPLQHQGEITTVAFSADGLKLATGSGDNTARVWDVESCRPIGGVLDHGGLVRAVAFSPDGGKLATASTDKTARLWDTSSMLASVSKVEFASRLAAAAISPDGTRLATATNDTALLRDRKTGNAVGEALQHPGGINVIAFSPDGLKLATGGKDRSTRVWDIASGKQLDEPFEHPGGGEVLVTCVAFSPDSKRLATSCSDGAAIIWELESRSQIGPTIRHVSAINSLAFSPDGTRLATGSSDHTARIWEVGNSVNMNSLHHSGAVYSVAFHRDGVTLATGCYDKSVRLWNIHSSKVLVAMVHGGPVLAVAFSPNGDLLATGATDRWARFWDLADHRMLGLPLVHQDAVFTVGFSADGRSLITGSHDGTARIWDTPTSLTESAEQIALWRESATALRVNDQGIFEYVTAVELQTTLERLEKAGGTPRSWLDALAKRHAANARPAEPKSQ